MAAKDKTYLHKYNPLTDTNFSN